MNTITEIPTIEIEKRISRRNQKRLLIAALLTSDILALGASFALAYWLRFEILPYRATYSLAFYSSVLLLLVPVWLIVFALSHLYDERYLLGGTQEYAHVFNACTVGMMLVIFYSFVFRGEDFAISRGWLLISWVLTILIVGGVRFSLRRVIYHLRRRGYFLTPAFIVGANEEGKALAEQLQTWTTSGLHLVGFIDDTLSPGTEVLNGLRVLGPTGELQHLVGEHGVGELVIAITALSRENLLGIFQAYGTASEVDIRLSSGLFEILTTGLQVKEVGYIPLVGLNKVRLTGLDVFLKTALDYIIAVPSLIVLSPLLLLIALLIKLDSPGPIIHRRQVLGVGGRQFDAFKFRTMVTNTDEVLDRYPGLKAQLEKNHKLKDDPRVTRLGRFLRKYSLDELPQLINVLKRDMSLVGPRMIAPEEAQKYGKWRMNLLTVRPGITGLWQVSGRSDISYEDKVRLDMYYIRNYTIWLDLHLIFRTLPVVLKGKGAY